MENIVLYKTETEKIELFFCEGAATKNIAFVFNPHGNRKLDGNLYGGDWLCRNGFDVISFKTIADDWYQNIPKFVFDLINFITRERAYEKRAAYGSSMGAYAAIAFSKTLNCDVVLAYSPQYRIYEDFDTRWQDFSKKINWQYEISAETVNKTCRFFITYDNFNIDGRHVDRIRPLLPQDLLTEIRLPYAGHPAIDYVADLGLIKDVVLNVFCRNTTQTLRLRQNKRHSKAYLFFLSNALFSKGKLQWALATINKAIGLAPAQARFYHHKSVILRKMGASKSAIETTNTALAIEPTNAYILAHYAELLEDNGSLVEACGAINGAIAENPRVASFHLRLSTISEKLGQNEQAIASAKQAVLLSGGVFHFKTHLLQLVVRLNKPEVANEIIPEVINDPASSTELLVFCGHLLLQLSCSEQAFHAFALAIARKPDMAAAHFGKSSALARLQRLEEAIDSGRTALSLDSANAQFINHLSQLLADKGELNEALSIAESGLNRQNKNAFLTAHYARLLVRMGKHENAIIWYREAIKINESVAGFHIDMSVALEKLGKISEALMSARRAQELASNDAYIANRFKYLSDFAHASASYA